MHCGKPLKKLAELLKNETIDIIYTDEVHFQQQTTVTLGWYKKGSKPRVASYPGKASLPCMGFVNPRTGVLFMTYPERFTGETVIEEIRQFLKDCPPEDGKRYAIIMDNAPWHTKANRLVEKEKSPEYEDIREKAFFVMLPPYSPDFNGIEQVWRVTRRNYTHNHFFRSVAELKATLSEAFSKWAVPNDELRTLCSFGTGEKARKRHARQAAQAAQATQATQTAQTAH